VIRLDVVTLFPDMVRNAVDHSILLRAQKAGLAEVNVINLRDFAQDRHHTTDDTPCGGGGGMLMMVEPIALALDSLRNADEPVRVLLTDPRGRKFDQSFARELAAESRLIVLCGHYEGVDERVTDHLVTDSVSIGDFVLTGGELPALVMIDAIIRLQEGALGGENAAERESHTEPLLEYPQYTRPRSFRGWEVPEILFSGHHAQIERWRRKQQFIRTKSMRPDLWERFKPTSADLKILKEIADDEHKRSVSDSEQVTVSEGPPD